MMPPDMLDIPARRQLATDDETTALNARYWSLLAQEWRPSRGFVFEPKSAFIFTSVELEAPEDSE